MVQKRKIEGLDCLCCSPSDNIDKIAYILYPVDILSGWIESAAGKYGTAIVVVNGMDWQNVLSPWPARGVPAGSPDFKGDAPAFLRLLQSKVLPQIEAELKLDTRPHRSLTGVSMSGLFALWQWMLCDTFDDIASLSGSFWYEGFAEWIENIKKPVKKGMAYFLLGNKETRSKAKIFGTVARNTTDIIGSLDRSGIQTVFQSVPGNHYTDPIPRLDKAFAALYPDFHRQ